jgi:hypothetical protein
VYENRQKTIGVIHSRAIPKIMLAGAVQLDSARISDYIKHRSLSDDRCQKIEQAVSDIIEVWDTFAPFRIILDSPELLSLAVASARNTVQNRLQVELEQNRLEVCEGLRAMTQGF